jgi:hypothetical protein
LRYLLNTEGERQYFETYCLPGALTATSGVGSNRRSIDSCEKSLLGLAVDRIGSQNCAAIPASAGTKDGGNRRAYTLVRDGAEKAPSDCGTRAPPRRGVGCVYAAMLLPPLFKLAKQMPIIAGPKGPL